MASPAPPPDTPPDDAVAQTSEPVARVRTVEHLEFKATLLLAVTLALVVGAALFLLYARGYFEPKQTLVLITDNSEGVSPGMDLTFSGFPIGTVREVGLGDEGNVRITIDVARKDAKWLRSSSVFTLVKGIVGGAQLRAYSGVLTDPPLPDGAERTVLRGDANAEIQRMINSARDVLDNLNELTAQNSELSRTVANLQTFTLKLQGKQGALHALMGNEDDARKIVTAIDRANAALARIDAVAARAESLAAKAETQVFGADGLVSDTRATIRQALAVLTDAQQSLQRLDKVLIEAQGIGANVRAGTADLGALRNDVEANLRKVEDMINELNRRWPFAKEREVKLP